MKKLFTAAATLAVIALALGASAATQIEGNVKITAADTYFATGSITLPTGLLTNAVYVPLYRTGEDGNTFRKIDRAVVKQTSGVGTGVVTIVTSDLTSEATVLTSGSLGPATAAYALRPRLATSITETGYAVTGNVVVATSPVRVEQTPYTARMLKITVVQTATNATDTAYSYVIYAD